MIKVTIADVLPNPVQETKSYVVGLLDETSHQLLPIWVGLWSGQAIAQILSEISSPRPLTFQFMADLLNTASVELESVRIEAIREKTYYAIASLRDGQQIRQVDARPSDAMALALQMSCPIYVAEELMEQQGIKVPSEMENFSLAKVLIDLKNEQTEQQEGENTFNGVKVYAKKFAKWLTRQN